MAAAKLTQIALAKKWRCSQPNIAQLVAKGMPLTSEADARAWKDANAERKGRVGLDEDERKLRLDLLRIERDQKRHNLKKSEQSLLPVAQFQRAWFKNHAALLAAINAFGPRVNEMLQGLDYNERAAVLEAESDRLRAAIAECDYLAPEDEREDS